MDVVWTAGVDADVQSLYERLDESAPGNGDLFYRAVLEAVGLLQAFPRLGPVMHRGFIRRVLVYKLRYGLYYSIESRGIILHTLLDQRQDPRRIKHRLRQI